MNQCPVHMVDWKTVPAGVSKTTGRPYNAFKACPVKGCHERPPRPQRPNGAQSASLGQPQASEGLSEKQINLAIISACMQFAATLYSGAGSSAVDEAKVLCREMYDQWRSRV